MQHYLILDGYNLIHRSKSGFQKGEWHIVFNFFRSLRPLIEKFLPVTNVIFTLEGHPKRQKDLLESYKGNRVASTDDFSKQKNLIIELLKQLPIQLLKLEDYEADDAVYSLLNRINLKENNVHATVVSSDSDFIQLLQSTDFDSKAVKLFNWRTDQYVTAPEYNYVNWKSLRGDSTDNIPRCDGMSEKKALDIINDKSKFQTLMQNENFSKQFLRNQDLIKLKNVSDAEWSDRFETQKQYNFDTVKKRFTEFDFQSMIKDASWEKWIKTFKVL